MLQIQDIREMFVSLYEDKIFVVDKTGCKMLEILSAQFFADEPSIFGALNNGYIHKELEWYNSRSLNISNMTHPIPKQWLNVADPQGYINSNYGYLVYDEGNYCQFDNVVNELLSNECSRRAVIIYNRPSMWYDYHDSGKNDFICCLAVQYFIRKNPSTRKRELIAHVNFRSNDVFSGYRNDKFFQEEVHVHLFNKLKGKYTDLQIGDMIWNAGSLHIYEKDFYLVEHYMYTGDWDVTKSQVENYRSEMNGNI